MAEKKKAEYLPTTEQLDLQERLSDDYVSPKVLVEGEVPSQVAEGGFVNVDPIYQNYSHDQDKPIHPEEGIRARLEEKLLGEEDVKAARKGSAPEGKESDDPVSDDKSEGDKSDDTKAETKSAPKASTSKPASK